MAIAMIILFPVLIKVNKTMDEVLSLFLDIPNKTVRNLLSKCDKFIASLNVEDEDEVNS